MEKFVTQLERHQQDKGEPLYQLAARLGISGAVVYKMVGRNYYPRRDGEFSIGYPLLKAVADDTGIPTDTLFSEAKAALQARTEETVDGED